MKIKKLLLLGLFVSAFIASCNDSTINSTSQNVDESSLSDSQTNETVSLHGKVSSFLDGDISNAEVSLSSNNKVITTTTNEKGEYEFDALNHVSGATLTVSKHGYRTFKTTLENDSDLYNVELAKTEEKVGSLVYKTWPNYEKFENYVTRNSEGIMVVLRSNNKVFTSADRNSHVEIYISSGEVNSIKDQNVTQIILQNDLTTTVSSYNSRTIDTSIYSPKVKDYSSDSMNNIEVLIPYENINATSEDILGISIRLWSLDNNDWANMYKKTTAALSDVDNPKEYVRFDKNNFTFVCKDNCYVEDLPAPEFTKEELTVGYNINFADPKTSNKPQEADDIYVKVTKTDISFKLEMIGFGTFISSEYVKIIMHTSSVNGTGWNIQNSDATFLINTSKSAYKTNITNFWDYVNFSSNDESALHQPEYKVLDDYFSLNFEIDFTEIPNYSPTGKVSIGLWEFDNGIIYDATPFSQAMFYNGIPVGDLALQSSYVTIQ